MRRPAPSHFSIENVFAAVRASLGPTVKCSVLRCPYATGVVGRFLNTLYAYSRRNQVNHITGDVHYLAFALPARTTILTIHDAIALKRLQGWRRRIYKYLWFTGPCRRVGVVTTISEATKSVLIEELELSPDKIIVIPDCIPSAFQASAPLVNRGRPVVLQVGTKKNKNLVRLAAALRGIECRLEIVGRLSAEQSTALAENGIDYRNSWNLSESQLLDKYRECDMLAFVSTAEGFGMPIVEAQAVGRAVLTSDISSMPEIAGDAACYADPYNVASIRDGLDRILHDRQYRDDLIAKGFRNAERFTATAVATAYRELYLHVSRN